MRPYVGEKKLFLCRWSCSVNSVNSQRKELDMKILLSEAVMPHKKHKSSCPAKAPLNLPERKTIVQT